MRLGARTLGAGALLIITIFAVRGAWGMYGKFIDASDAESQAQAQLAELSAQYAQVEGQVQSLSSERGQEGELRARYGVAKAGEGEIDIVRQATTSGDGSRAGEPWWQRLWEALHIW